MRSPTSPRTPTHARHRSSTITSMPSPGYTSPIVPDSSPIRVNNQHRPHSRKSSLNNSNYPPTPLSPSQQTRSNRRMSIRSINGGGSVTSDVSHSELVSGGGGMMTTGNGLGSLADELADAWDEEEEDGEMSMDHSGMDADHVDGKGDELDERDSEVWMNGGDDFQSSPPVQVKSGRRRAQQRGSVVDGNDDDEMRDPYEMSPSLEVRLEEIERLAQRGMKIIQDPSDVGVSGEKEGVMDKMVHALRDLGGQAGLEAATTRFITTQFTLSNSLSNQQRTLHSLAYPLFFSPLSNISSNISSLSHRHPSSDPDHDLFTELLYDLDSLHSLLPSLNSHHPPSHHRPHHSQHQQQNHPVPSDLLVALSPLLPRKRTKSSDTCSNPSDPTISVLSTTISLHPLSSTTAELIQTLNHLQDTIYISHQTVQAATRALRSTRGFVGELLRELTEVDDSIAWIERGRWQEKLARRECAAVCREVVRGFEEGCEGVRDRLVDYVHGGGVIASASASLTTITTTAGNDHADDGGGGGGDVGDI